MTVRLTRRVRRIVDAIHTLNQPWGLTICQATRLGPSTVYPILDRLLEAGWIDSRTETAPAGRPPHTVYHLTLRGQHAAGLQSAGHDDGPSVKEAAGDDRRWFDAEREGS